MTALPDVPPPSRSFYWTGRDISDAGLIAYYLTDVWKGEHAEAIVESAVELQCRPPRLTDAWRFFHAAAQLRKSYSAHAAKAQQIGARIALGVTGWMVSDMVLAEVGNSAGLGMYIEGRPEQPVVTLILDADGTTAVERWQRDFPRPMGAP